MNEKNKKISKPILIEKNGHVECHKDPDTGEKMWSTAIYREDFEAPKRENVNVYIKWCAGIPLTKQLAILKKICMSLNSKTNAELLASIKGTKEWKVGEFIPWEAEELLKKAKEQGLQIIIMEKEQS